MNNENSSQNIWVPLVDYRRNGVPECTLHGSIAWFSGKKLIYSYGGNVLCYGRSMMKPVMAKVFRREFEDHFSLPQKAIFCSSHNGDTEHIRTIQSILSPNEMGLLQTPHALPLMQFGVQKRRPRRYYHPCSGEHAGIIKGCQLKGWSRVGYIWPHHPFFQAYLKILKGFLGENWKAGRISKDGCGLPTLAMTVNELAQIYAGLVRERNEDWVWEAMVSFPDLIGGFNRLDSTILKATEGKVLAKEGADGLLGLAVQHPDFPEGLGIVIKIAHGWDMRASWYVARWSLGVLGFEFRNPYPLDRQKAFIVPETIPEKYRQRMNSIEPWDSWDPDRDRWLFDPKEFCPEENSHA